MPSTSDELLDAEEAGRILECHPRTVKRLTLSNPPKLTPITAAGKGRPYLFRRSDVEALAAERAKAAEAKAAS